MPGVSEPSSHGPGAVAEQHAGRAVVEVQDAREHLGSDHQRLARAAGLDHRVRDGERVHEAAANGLHVESGAAGDAQLVLQDAGRGGEDHVRRGGGDDDQIDILGLDARGLDCMARGLHTEIAGRDIGGREVAGANARARDDPFIGGFLAARSAVRSALVARRMPRCR
jgi:hypothetical protein